MLSVRLDACDAMEGERRLEATDDRMDAESMVIVLVGI